MNIHPLIVHFPIGLLTTYAIFELIRFEFVTRQLFWFYIKAILVILGTLSSYAAVAAGLLAKGLINNESILAVVDKHQFFGISTAIIFTVISIIYIRAWRQNLTQPVKITLALAVLGLICIFIAGGLGGSIVYGPASDPVTNWVYHLFFNN